MQSIKPLVSIIMPAFNAEATISDSINSVLAQTYENYELIIADDGSLDATYKIISSYKDPRIKYLYQDQSGVGCPGSARNLALASATGEYIAFLDSDDLWDPLKLEIQINYFINNHYHVDLIYTDYATFTSSAALALQADVYPPQLFSSIFNNLLVKNYIPTLTVMVKAQVIQDVGLFRIDLHGVEDWDLWLRISHKYRFHFIDTLLAYYRISDTSITGNRLRHLNNEFLLVEEYIANNLCHSPIVANAALAFLEAKRIKYLILYHHYSSSIRSFCILLFRLIKIYPVILPFILLLVKTLLFQKSKRSHIVPSPCNKV